MRLWFVAGALIGACVSAVKPAGCGRLTFDSLRPHDTLCVHIVHISSLIGELVLVNYSAIAASSPHTPPAMIAPTMDAWLTVADGMTWPHGPQDDAQINPYSLRAVYAAVCLDPLCGAGTYYEIDVNISLRALSGERGMRAREEIKIALRTSSHAAHRTFGIAAAWVDCKLEAEVTISDNTGSQRADDGSIVATRDIPEDPTNFLCADMAPPFPPHEVFSVATPHAPPPPAPGLTATAAAAASAAVHSVGQALTNALSEADSLVNASLNGVPPKDQVEHAAVGAVVTLAVFLICGCAITVWALSREVTVRQQLAAFERSKVKRLQQRVAELESLVPASPAAALPAASSAKKGQPPPRAAPKREAARQGQPEPQQQSSSRPPDSNFFFRLQRAGPPRKS